MSVDLIYFNSYVTLGGNNIMLLFVFRRPSCTVLCTRFLFVEHVYVFRSTKYVWYGYLIISLILLLLAIIISYINWDASIMHCTSFRKDIILLSFLYKEDDQQFSSLFYWGKLFLCARMYQSSLRVSVPFSFYFTVNDKSKNSYR